MVVRCCGTVVGAVMSIVIWEISQSNPYALTVLQFIFYLPCWYVFLNTSAPGKFWRTTGQFAMITNSLSKLKKISTERHKCIELMC